MNSEQRVGFLQKYLMFKIRNLPPLLAQDAHIRKYTKQVVASWGIFSIFSPVKFDY